MDIYTHKKHLDNYKKYIEIRKATHLFLKSHNYLELQLPHLSPSLVPESYLEVFETTYRFFDTEEKLYLTPSPEIFMKRILAAKIGDCYSLTKSFRNSEKPGEKHLSEFEMLEFYKTHVNYSFIKNHIQRLLYFIAMTVFKTPFITYKGHVIYLDKPWEEITVSQAFETYANISEEGLFNHDLFKKKAQEKGYSIDNASFVDLFSQIYTQEIEPHLGTKGVPTIITDYPKEMAALAKLNANNKTAQRFEFYIEGVELGDCYTELTNAAEQKKRFTEEYEERKKTNKIDHPVDWGFIKALEEGLPDCSGIAIGFDRLVMVLLDTSSVTDHQLITIE